VNEIPILSCGGLTLDWVRDAAGTHGPTVGGNALYAGVGAWLAGARVDLVAVVGADFPRELLTQMETAGLGIATLRRVDSPSFRVLLDNTGGERVISYLPGSGTNAELDPLPHQIPADHPALGAHVAAIPTASQRDLVETLTARDLTVTLDTVVIPGQIEPDPQQLLHVARMCSAFLPSREEFRHLWPEFDPLDAVTTMSRWAAPTNVIKLGADGSCGADRSGHLQLVPAYGTAPVDTTGAGDSYCGAFCTRLAGGDGLLTAMCWATAAASLVIEHFSCIELLDDEGRQTVRRLAAHLLTKTEPARTTT
jgi:sugar/nucleoside kinase (ribokinase family)